MTQRTVDFLNVVIAIASFLVPSIQLITNKDRQGFKRITAVGWILLAVALLMLFNWIASYHIKQYENKEAERLSDSTKSVNDSIHKLERKEDSINLVNAFQKALKPEKREYNPETGKITELSPVIGRAAITGLPNPLLVKEGDTLMFKFSFTNYKDALAKNIKTYFSIVNPAGNDFYISTAKNNLANELLIVNNKTNYQINKPIKTLHPSGEFNQAYAYVKIEYSNEQGRVQPPFRGIWQIDQKLINQNLPIANADEYTKIKKVLSEKGDW